MWLATLNSRAERPNQNIEVNSPIPFMMVLAVNVCLVPKEGIFRPKPQDQSSTLLLVSLGFSQPHPITGRESLFQDHRTGTRTGSNVPVWFFKASQRNNRPRTLLNLSRSFEWQSSNIRPHRSFLPWRVKKRFACFNLPDKCA